MVVWSSRIILFVPVRIHKLTAAHGLNRSVPNLPQAEALPGSECDVTAMTGEGRSFIISDYSWISRQSAAEAAADERNHQLQK